MKTAQKKIETEIGPLYLVASEKGLRAVIWKKQADPMSDETTDACGRLLSKAEKQIREYLAGTRKEFDLPLDIIGTDFQKRVWSQLVQIPYGQTWSYKTLALRVQDGNSSRAVGTANGKNPLSLIVPCHRVIASDGTLGGYAGGLDIKRKLLEMENQESPSKTSVLR